MRACYKMRWLRHETYASRGNLIHSSRLSNMEGKFTNPHSHAVLSAMQMSCANKCSGTYTASDAHAAGGANIRHAKCAWLK